MTSQLLGEINNYTGTVAKIPDTFFICGPEEKLQGITFVGNSLFVNLVFNVQQVTLKIFIMYFSQLS